MLNKETNDIEYDTKLRGLTLDIHAEESFTYETFKKHVLEFGEHPEVKIYQQQFMPRIHEGEVYTKDVKKSYEVICAKGIIDDESPFREVLPFGV